MLGPHFERNSEQNRPTFGVRNFLGLLSHWGIDRVEERAEETERITVEKKSVTET